MKRYNKARAGNRFEVTVCNAGKVFLLWDSTRQMLIADSGIADELILYAKHYNMISGDAVVMS